MDLDNQYKVAEDYPGFVVHDDQGYRIDKSRSHENATLAPINTIAEPEYTAAVKCWPTISEHTACR
jgi:hypothetical protein